MREITLGENPNVITMPAYGIPTITRCSALPVQRGSRAAIEGITRVSGGIDPINTAIAHIKTPGSA